MKTMRAEHLQGHDLVVARSLALHRAVADKIRAQPELMMVARQNLARWIAEEQRHGSVSSGLLEWQHIFDTSTAAAILDRLGEESEPADRLRHATPFTGILTETERAAIYQDYAALSA